ncbi:MAG: oligosaccharide flippase family protein [Bacteroidaceae bacterium]|nr:oligosaccharide flippase family protein [Bacteroidaceae bacterium]
MSQVANRIIKNTGWLYVKMSITMFISLWVTRLILLSLGASDFGIYAIVGGAISMLGFFNGALSSATVRFMAYAEGQSDQNKKTTIFNVCSVLHLCIAAIMVLVLLVAALIFFNGVLNIPPGRMNAAYVVYGSLVSGVFFDISRVPYDSVVNAHEHMKFYAILGIVESLLKLAVAFACVYTSKDKLVVYGVLMAVIPLVSYFATRGFCKRRYSECVFAPRIYWDKKNMKEMLSFASWNFTTSMASMISFYGSGIVLNHFFGTLLNAAYGIANQLNGQLMTFSSNMLKAVIPVITKSEGSGQRTAMIHRSTIACKYSYLILAIFAIPFILEMNFILRIWLKEVPEWAVLFSQLTLVQSLISQMTIAYVASIHAEGNISLFSKVRSVFNLITIVLIVLFFALGSSPVMLFVVSIGWTGIVGAVSMVYFMKRNCGMEYGTFIRNLLFPVLGVTSCSILIGIIPMMFMEASFIRLITTSCLSLIGFCIGYWLLATNDDEKNVIRNVVKLLYAKIIRSR